MMIEHVDAMIDIRRSLVMNDGTVPVNAQATLESLRETDTQRGVETSFRFDWAADLRLPEAKPGERAEHILWVGESAFDLMAQRTLRSLVRLMREGGLDPHVLGAAELDCGDVARRMGDEETFQSLATRNIATLSQLDFGTIITADPHAMQVLKNEYRELGGNFSVLHHTELLAQLLDEQRIVPKVKLECSVTYHDPCYLGRYNDVFSAPRQILSAIGADLKEMDRSGRRSHCCGGGGAAPLLDIPGERRIPDMRMRQIEDTGAECVAVACPGCAVMLEGVADKKANVRDVAEMLLDCVEGRS
jgi:Fe-S oxidoreductase